MTGIQDAGDLVTAFSGACERFADRTAVVDRDTRLTYQQLQDRVERASRVISTELGHVGGAPLVMIVVEPSAELTCALLATVAAGAAYLPVDVATPDGYLRTIVEDARPDLVVTSAERAAELGGLGVPVLTVDSLAKSVTGDFAQPRRLGPDDPAYVIYTSGSTGRPKGVVVGHGAMLNSTAARCAAYGVPTRMPLVHSIAFDLASGVVFWALLAGGTLIISRSPLSDVANTLDLIRRHAVTHLVYAASLYAPFLDRAALDPPASLEHIMIGSERWSSVLIGRHAELLPGASLYNEYGPSEACVWSSYARVYDSATGEPAPLTLGKPILNTGYRVLTESGEPVVAGGRGELLISGRNLALGYLHRPELTAERFVRQAGGERAYRTGDVVEVTRDGEHVFAGRIDRQLKVQGNRIEAGHVETLLMSHPDVQQAHVVSRNDTGLGSTLVSYLVLRDGSAGGEAPADLDSHLRSRAPAYLVPATHVVLPRLPRTLNGKIDEGRLPVPGPAVVAGGVEPADALETALAAQVSEILGVEVGVETALGSVGANSLAFVRMSAAITRAHGVDIPMSSLFDRPTIRAFAEEVRSARRTDRPALVPRDRHEAASPLSAQQHQIWFLHHLSPDALAYNTQFTLRLTGELEPPVLERALSAIVERHEILRTTFHDGPDGPVQVVHAPWEVSVGRTDLRGVDPAHRREAMEADKRTRMDRVFDIAELPLVRWQLYRLGDDRWELFQSEHHFVHDGWSASLFLKEIRDAYQAEAEECRTAAEPLAVQYRDYARWYQEWKQSKDFAGQAEYWRSKLDGCPAQGVTFDSELNRPAKQGFNGACLRTDIPAGTIDRIDALCGRYHVTRFAVFLAAFGILVWRHTAEEDFVIGSALSNRRQSETAAMLGMFVNALPLRLTARPGDTVASHVHAAMRTILEAQDNQEFPLIEIIKRLDLPRDPARNPLFQLMFAFHDSPRPSFALDGLAGELWIDHNGSAKNDLNVVCVPNPARPGAGTAHDGLNILWEYNREVFTEATAAALLRDFEHIVGAIADHWTTPLVDVALLGPESLDRILGYANGVESPAAHPTLHGGVNAAIEAVAHEVAVRQGDVTVTYADLDALAAGLETDLIAVGVGPGDFVAVAGPMSADLIAAWLAVLRRGAAYLCVDQELPRARIDLLLADAAPAVLVCPEDVAPRFAGTGVKVLVHNGKTAVRPESPTPAEDRPAYLVYTSGSTGTPKAVVTSHRNAVTALHARTVHFGPEAPCTLVTLPANFDVAGSMVFWTLSLGGTLVLPAAGTHRDPEVIRSLVERNAVSHVNFVASFYRQFLETVPSRWASPLKVVAIGGEACTADVVALHADRVPEAGLHNEYGPTEATVWCSAATVYTPGEPVPGGRVTVGRPLANYAMYVLDERGQPMPLGARGELYVGGDGVAPGYLGRPELTADRFVTIGSGPLAGRRLYRTGDEARLRHDGEFEIVGRLDDQVKIRGFRIETGEVRRCLTEHHGVADAHVVAEPHLGHVRLVAYVATASGPEITPALTEWLGARLPSYMVPAALVVLPSLPLTTTGKVDRARLPTPDAAEGVARTVAAAETPAQEKLLDLWRTVLGRADVGVDDDFFQLGGDSLQSIRLATRARAEGIPLTVSRILQARTIRALTAESPGTRFVADRVRRPAGTPVPLTAIQSWFFDQGFADPDHFNQARVHELTTDAETAVLLAAITHVVDRHEAFRTLFTGRDAVLGHEPTVLVDRQEIAGVAQIEEAMAAHQHGLDIGAGRMGRFTVFESSGDGKRLLGVVLHHLVVDAVSWDILGDDIAAALRGTPMRPAPGPATEAVPVPTPAAVEFWTALAEAPKPVLPWKRPGGRSPYGELCHLRRTHSAAATENLVYDLPRLSSVSPRAALLAALCLALGSDELYVQLEGHGRNGLEGAEETVGWLTAMHPALLHTGGATGLTAAARAVDRQLDAIPGDARDFGVARYLRRDTELGRVTGTLELPAVTFNYLGQAASPGTNDVLRPSAAGTGSPLGAANVLPTPFDLTVAVRDDRLETRLTYDPAVVEPGFARAVLDRFDGMLENAARLVELTDAAVRKQFLVHPIGGSVEWYAPLARRLASSWSCVGIAQRDTTGSVEELAEQYVAGLRALQAKGPYRLTGWSFGAAVAYRMAVVLEGQGEVVSRLSLLDPPPIAERDDAVGALTGHLRMLLPDQAEGELRAAITETVHFGLEERVEELVRRLVREDDDAAAFQSRRLETLVRNTDALAAWRPGATVEAEIDLVYSEAGHRSDEAAAWSRCTTAGAVTTVVAGSHVSMLGDDTVVELLGRSFR
ncbi:amino acid adenylation domain-containing protein [Amycolatopsis sp. NPDC088138]|uniref:amino acid adenylation domain-containing protein n=1 Tax=Amycolatopsis sp. NPDC088138 TaxID=3363938 RepID=UPI00381E0349